jgi:hypothetical protein
VFTLFWAALADLPQLIGVQQAWLDRFRGELRLDE